MTINFRTGEEMSDKEDDKLGSCKYPFSKALAKILQVAEDEGYYDGWDMGFELGSSSGQSHNVYKIVEWIVTAYDKTLADFEYGSKEYLNFDASFNAFLNNFEELAPFTIDFKDKLPVWKEDEDEEDGD